MSVEMKGMLDKTTQTAIQGLIQTNLDSRDGLREAAKNLSDESVVELFQDIARDRETQAAELSRIIAANCDEPLNTGSVMAAAHRAWIDIRALLGGGTKAMLAEAKRGEEFIKSEYEKVLQNNPSFPLAETLQSHYAAVNATYEAIRFMCEDRLD